MISHEDVSESLLRSAELILGNQKNVYTYSLKRGEDIEIFGEKINEKIEELKNEKILILTDMFGGDAFKCDCSKFKKV
ncbi:MAG: PTS sugar transporter subunit IIA [Holdemanella porci]|uniref:PTS sugar transporter subunit IIA n=1 Tax=Holdemanella porci TaxID=2652276 RepID=UPI0039947E62